jgi:lycopene cyclase domain-containing protein
VKTPMLPASTGYLFLELAFTAYILGFGWEFLVHQELRHRSFWLTAFGLACFWFIIDQVALWLGLWTFPENGTLPFRLFSLPPEEYILFFLHTLLCLMLLRQYSSLDEP